MAEFYRCGASGFAQRQGVLHVDGSFAHDSAQKPEMLFLRGCPRCHLVRAHEPHCPRRTRARVGAEDQAQVDALAELIVRYQQRRAG